MLKLQYPLKGYPGDPTIKLSQSFGGNKQIYQQFGMEGHNGLDYACLIGTPVLAVHDGRIEFYQETTNYGNGYGKNVRLYFEEDGFTWDCVYGHLDGYSGVNREVKAGEVIGYSGNTGFSTGPHLHFGIRKLKNGQVVDYNNGYLGYLDPMPIFRGRNKMEIFKILGEETLVVKNLDGKYYTIATKPELYPVVAEVFGFTSTTTFDPVDKATVEANYGGQAKATIAFVPK